MLTAIMIFAALRRIGVTYPLLVFAMILDTWILLTFAEAIKP